MFIAHLEIGHGAFGKGPSPKVKPLESIVSMKLCRLPLALKWYQFSWGLLRKSFSVGALWTEPKTVMSPYTILFGLSVQREYWQKEDSGKCCCHGHPAIHNWIFFQRSSLQSTWPLTRRVLRAVYKKQGQKTSFKIHFGIFGWSKKEAKAVKVRKV